MDDIMLIRLQCTILMQSPVLKMGYRIKRYKLGNISEDSDKEKINFNNIVLKV